RGCDEAGLSDFLDAALEAECPENQLFAAFERLFFLMWLDYAFHERRSLRGFSRSEHERAIHEYRELDLDQLRLARSRLRARLLEKLPDSSWKAATKSELGILQREIRRKRGHMPLRKLFQLIPNALAQLKPCFMMSPLSVAQFLDPRSMQFDVVVFDEASQIAPEDAVGAIARGKQLVVVGDSKQLPPTAFFQRAELADSSWVDEDETPDLESILDECVVSGFPRRMLQWHYRSRHESLIAFSNANFYEGRLHTFPSPNDDKSELGVDFVYVEDGVFDRSKTRSNPNEAKRVAEAVIEHFRKTPELSLGVGTFSQAQQVAILDTLEEMRRQDESLEEFFASDRSENFFVKNLENIQGDERDVIFVSVGYGRDAQKKLYLNFGPLNKTGGERRLNVLMTRARRRLTLFSSIRGSDIDSSRVSSNGALLFKNYLDFAEHGDRVLNLRRDEDDHDENDNFLSKLDETITDQLSDAGLSLERGVGFSKHRLALGVRDPERPERYVLGVDWDGVGYQTGDTARDRDRLRQQVLEGLGWRLHRIWATEWHRNPRAEIDRVLSAVESARKNELEPEVLPLLAALEKKTKKSRPKAKKKEESDGNELPIPYELATLEPGGESDEFDSATRSIQSRLVQLVKVEAPVHRDEAARRVAACWSITRLTKAVQKKIGEAIDASRDKERLEVDPAGFLWRPNDRDVLPRHRDVEGSPREPELIALEELETTARLILEREFRLARDDLISQTAKLLGFSRAGKKLKDRVGEAVTRLVEEGDALDDDGSIAVVSSDE
ncbi:MAG: DUF3320 domain-containing protein, partial [Planctomycetota bacterium]